MDDYIKGLAIIGLSLPLYWLVLRSPQARMTLLAVCSALLLILVSPRTLVVPLLGGLASFYLAAWVHQRPTALRLWAALAVPLAVLASYRYLQPLAHDAGLLEKVVIPLGLSYYTFKQMHFIIEASRGQARDTTLSSYLLYLIYFPMFVAGPIERIQAFSKQLSNPGLNTATVSEAIERIVFGLAKAFIISQLLLEPLLPADLDTATLFAMDWHVLVLVAFIKFLRVYFDFSGYTDIAIGVSLLFNIRLMENFQSPLSKTNLAEFWRAWHISLSSWARDYVYFPVMGRFRMPSLALFLTMMTIGAWHSLEPGWLLWGFHHGLGLVLLAKYHRATRRHKTLNAWRQTPWFKTAGIAAVWLYVSIGHGLTLAPASITDSLLIYSRLLGPGYLI